MRLYEIFGHSKGNHPLNLKQGRLHYRKKWIVVFFLYVGLSGMFIYSESCQPGQSPKGTSYNATFVGSATCASCHAHEFQEWKQSDHFLAMQVATDSTILGDFNNAVLTADGVINTFLKRNGKFYIQTKEPSGQNQEYEVLYTFGHYPLQQYLVSFPGGKLQATRASWDSRDKKWFHQYAGHTIPSNDWLHWTGNGQNWNTMCASCHSTDLQKNYSFDQDTYITTWNEINVSCESCHGPGCLHVYGSCGATGSRKPTTSCSRRPSFSRSTTPLSGSAWARIWPSRSASAPRANRR